MELLENDVLRVAVSPETGAITGLLNKKLRHELIAFPALAECWRLSIPYEDDSCFMVFSKDQTRRPALEREDDTLRLTWERIAVGRDDAPIRVTLVLALSGDELLASMEIENASPFTVEHAWFPVIGATGALSADGSDQLLVTDSWGGRNSQLRDLYHRDWTAVDWTMAQFHRYYPYRDQHIQFWYPYPLIMQWMEYYVPDRGVFLGSRDNEYFVSRFWLEQDRAESGITFAIIKSPFVGPGQTWRSPESVFAFHAGDWHVGADKYRAWFESWAVKRRVPEWIKRLEAWHSIQTAMADIHVFHEYKDYPKLARQSKDCDVDAIHIHCGVHREGVEGGYPYWNRFSEKQGGREALVKAIHECHEIGVKLITLTKDNRVNAGLPDYETKWKPMEIRHRDGAVGRICYPVGALDTRITYGGGKQLATMCMTSPEWRRHQLDEFVKLAELGLDGNQVDEWDCGKFYCFSPEHGHEHPGDMIKSQIAFARELRERTDEVNPEFYYAAEEMFDATFQYFDTSFSRSYNYPGNKEHFQYTFPHFIRTMEIFEHDYRRLNQAFAHARILLFYIRGGKGTLADFPEFAAYAKELIRLKRVFYSYFREGLFRDTLELEEFTPDDPLLMAATYTHNGNTLAVFHNGADRHARATFGWAARPVNVRRLAPFEQDQLSENLDTVTVPPQRLVILEALRGE